MHRLCAPLSSAAHWHASSKQWTRPLTTFQNRSDIANYLSKPSWSVKSALSPVSSCTSEDEVITREKLHHLLRLSALPMPKSHAEEDKLIHDLKRQLHFVKVIQAVNTEGVEPIVAIRDETEAGHMEREIGMEDPDIKRALTQEKRAGRRGRIVTTRSEENETKMSSAEEKGWDPLAQAGRRVGRYFAVDTAND